VVACQAVLREDPYAQNRLLVLDVKDDRIGESIVICNELLDDIPIQNVALLTLFLD
jgi:SAM-dependent MidA family methyltransferase